MVLFCYEQTILIMDKAKISNQQGGFFEIYSIEYPRESPNKPPKRVGNLWEFGEEIELVISPKKAKVYQDDSIKIYMGGIPIRSIDKHLHTAINKGWTVIIYNQLEISPKKFIRVFNKHSITFTNN